VVDITSMHFKDGFLIIFSLELRAAISKLISVALFSMFLILSVLK